VRKARTLVRRMRDFGIRSLPPSYICTTAILIERYVLMPNAENDAANWKKFDILLASFQNVGKWQSSLVNKLIGFLCLVWVVDILHKSGGITVSILGASIQISGFWQVVPIITFLLSLGLIGSINLIHHSWRRLDLMVTQLFADKLFFVELDSNKNILDYIALLTLRLKKPVLPDTIANGMVDDQRWNLSLWLYPLLLLFSIYTTSFTVRRVDWSPASFSLILVSTVAQAVFAVPFIWRKACLFVGEHKNAYEGVEWGTAGLTETIKKMVQMQ
jgi:hypothetical protein